VRITCIAEERGQGLLCSTHQARRPHYSVFHDAERLSDRENQLDAYHPAFQTTDPTTTDDANDEEEKAESVEPAGVRASASGAVEDAIAFITVLGWPPATARAAVEHVCHALARAGSRQSAFEVLRRDKHSRALLDLPGTSWTALLRALLGNPAPGVSATSAGRGILLRLLIGETLPVLLHDDDLVLAVSMAAPKRGGGGR